ncbi:MAG: tetratricopeptide repeat protein [Hyphomicrobium sp.]|uniref:tetratricopeptide repeat protein n=1 Tax=Hyphomicrobium sp. TaxID=82 RepID=UPI0013274AEF|nr:tetratricopeptide repeat protein [Hyphomicrobium sp.]KAB2942227.1 MAG: tetratricopeptide repeat protein [Hyphomicrobium sp.]MBZ0208364.1 tetratricopeptide repeat protein [Hyphomicrobium sp.]
MRSSLRKLLHSTATAIGMFTASLSASQAANEFTTDSDSHSLLGSYLAANLAKGSNDNNSAAAFYRSALALDPSNAVLLEQAFQTEAAEGHWDRAVPLARQLVAKDAENRMAHLLLGLDSFKGGDYQKADEEFRKASDGPIGELTSALARAWAAAAAGNAQRALKLLEMPKQAEWAQFYLNYHKALIADVMGRPQEAQVAYEHSMRQDATTLRIALAFARHAAHEGNFKRAKEILDAQSERAQSDPHVLVRELRDAIGPDKKTELLITTPVEGMAEVFYGLGEALTSEGGLSMGVLYLQLALYAKPDHAFALAALASAYETGQRYQDAIDAYDRIPPGTALQSAIDIRKAFDLNSLEKVDEAKAILDRLVKQSPDDLKPLDALGNILRARKRYAEAAEVYTQAMKLIPKPDKRHWSIFYSRGTCYERLKNWPAAEADLRKALELFPDQPLALNYLGYSWVDQNRNLKQGMALIEKAVALKPDDGYIVDSLGWAHFKLGNYAEAVRFLERAVELKPQDPVLNDHLGDALWRVGREREAKFQWDQALTLDPEPEEVEKIKKKLAEGLPPSVEARAGPRETMRRVHQKRRKETKLNPALVE